MTIRYEANPPKILPGTDIEESILSFAGRIRRISQYCNAVHLTEDVLGFSRVSPLDAGRTVGRILPDLTLTASLRVRDKTLEQVDRFVAECLELGFSGILVLMGDPRRDGRPDSGLVPSMVARHIRKTTPGIGVYLSVPAGPDFAKLYKKKAAGPDGFMTQVIQSVRQVRTLAENLAGFSVIPIVMYPSPKNAASAKFLNLDMSYADNFAGFVSEILDVTGDILLTSPSDFEGLYGFMRDYSKYSASG